VKIYLRIIAIVWGSIATVSILTVQIYSHLGDEMHGKLVNLSKYGFLAAVISIILSLFFKPEESLPETEEL